MSELQHKNSRPGPRSFLHHDNYSGLWRRDNSNNNNNNSSDVVRLTSVRHRREDSDDIKSDTSSDNINDDQDDNDITNDDNDSDASNSGFCWQLSLSLTLFAHLSHNLSTSQCDKTDKIVNYSLSI